MNEYVFKCTQIADLLLLESCDHHFWSISCFFPQYFSFCTQHQKTTQGSGQNSDKSLSGFQRYHDRCNKNETRTDTKTLTMKINFKLWFQGIFSLIFYVPEDGKLILTDMGLYRVCSVHICKSSFPKRITREVAQLNTDTILQRSCEKGDWKSIRWRSNVSSHPPPPGSDSCKQTARCSQPAGRPGGF